MTHDTQLNKTQIFASIKVVQLKTNRFIQILLFKISSSFWR